MSCCGGNCGCGPSCNCGSGCGGCKMYPDFSFSGESSSETLIAGVAPQKGSRHSEGFEATAGSENGGCKCGSSCTCDPCTCK
ncbi:hypothetical protein AAC387_Pa05g3785 [Persea americana]